ncbi:MAG: SxtJ family membrane protein [Proteobacteria bacterium]|nr:SxtJ family membrane protein [Pseudomonadota bacterium]
MTTHDIPELDRKGLREFGLVTGAIFVALFGLFFPWLLELNSPIWPWVLGASLAIWGLAAPTTLGPVYRAWMRLGLLISKITTPVVLGVVFFLVIFPTGFVMRLFGRDPMTRQIDEKATSYRVPSTKPSKNAMERPF